MKTDKANSNTSRDMTLNELIWSELYDKNAAIKGYDSMLWKIRSGYVTILYGALSLLGIEVLNSPWLSLSLIYGFSVCAFIVDQSFLHGKIKVVIARDRLVDIARQLAVGANHTQFRDLPVLLHNSGEDPKFPFESEVHKYIWSWTGAGQVLVLYAITPMIGTIVSVLYLS